MAVKQTAGRDALGEFAPKFAQLNDDVLFGEVWSREDKLSLRDRSLVTVVALMSRGLVDSSTVSALRASASDRRRISSLSSVMEAPVPAALPTATALAAKPGGIRPMVSAAFASMKAPNPPAMVNRPISSGFMPASPIRVSIPAQTADFASCTARISCWVRITPVPGSRKAG